MCSPRLSIMHKHPFWPPFCCVEFTTANANVGVTGWRKQNVVVNFGKMLAFSLFKQKQMLALTQRLHFNFALFLKWLGSTFVGGFSFILN